MKKEIINELETALMPVLLIFNKLTEEERIEIIKTKELLHSIYMYGYDDGYNEQNYRTDLKIDAMQHITKDNERKRCIKKACEWLDAHHEGYVGEKEMLIQMFKKSMEE